MNFPDSSPVQGRVPANGVVAGNKRKKKRVCFAHEIHVVCGSREMLKESERFRSWWQHDEFEETKTSARVQSRKLRKMAPDICLSDAYDRACSIADDSGFDLESSHASQGLVPNERLVQYCLSSDIRGLERLICRNYAVCRARGLNDVKNAVLLEQARQFLAQERNEEAISRLAQEASRGGRAFAALMGHADAAAVKLPDQDDIPVSKNAKRIEPVKDFALEDPISDDSSSEEELAASSPIFISIQTLH